MGGTRLEKFLGSPARRMQRNRTSLPHRRFPHLAFITGADADIAAIRLRFYDLAGAMATLISGGTCASTAIDSSGKISLTMQR